jgi:lysozyme family protein
MIPTIDSILDEILRREGGYVDHPADRGGCTNHGITRATLAAYIRRPATCADVRALTREVARNIYRNQYITAPQLHRILDPYVLALAVDCSVNHGPDRVVKWLQVIAGVKADGKLGPISEAAINSIEPVHLYQRLLARRVVFYGEIVNRNRNQAEFILGWLRRAAEFIETP